MAGATPACRVAITGTAFIVADATVYVDHTDALSEGFQLASASLGRQSDG
jgi:proline racemase